MQTTWSRPYFSYASLTLAVFSLFVATGLIFSHYYTRLGFSTPLYHGITVLALGGLIFAFPALLYTRSGRYGGWHGPWWGSAPALHIALVFGVTLAGWLLLNTGINLMPILTILGLGCILAALTLWLRGGDILWKLVFGGFSAWFGTTLLTGRHPALLPEIIVTQGGHIDNVFHAATSQMLITYGVPSTGLNGLPYVPNHYLTHWIFGHIAALIDIDIITFYVLGYPALIAVMTVTAMVGLALIVRHLLADQPLRPLWRDGVFWLVLFLGIHGVISADQMRLLSMDVPRLFRSESQAAGVALTLLLAAVLLIFMRDYRQRTKQGVTASDALLLLLVLPVMAVLLGLTKFSQLTVAVPVVVWLWLRLGLFRRPVFLLALVLNLGAAFVIYQHVSVPDPDVTYIEPFSFFRTQVADDGKPTFFLLYFAWTWLYVGLVLWRLNARSLGDAWRLLREGRLLDVEMLVIASLAGFGIVSIFFFNGGTPRLFLNFQRWLALPLVMGLLSSLVLLPSPRPKLSNWSLAGIGIGLLTLMLSVQAIYRMDSRVSDRFRADTGLRQLVGDERPGLRQAVFERASGTSLELFPDPNEFDPVIKAHPWQPMARIFAELNALPLEIKRETALFIPRDNRLYWDYTTCNEIPFYAPMLTGLAMIDGLPEPSCEAAIFYGYIMYTLTDSHLSVAEPDALCAAAAAWHLSRVEIIEAVPDGVMRRTLSCEEQQRPNS